MRGSLFPVVHCMHLVVSCVQCVRFVDLCVWMYSETSLIRHSMEPERKCRIWRLSDYGVTLSILSYGDCTS